MKLFVIFVALPGPLSKNFAAVTPLNRFSMIKNGATQARVSYRGLPVYNWNLYPQSTSENVRTFNFFPVFLFFLLFFIYSFIIYLSLSFIIIITCIIIIVCFSVFITLCLDLVVGKKNKQTNKKPQDPFSFTYSTTVCGRYKYEKANIIWKRFGGWW